jgi:apolipoprotein N-acyltransferase
VTLVSSRVRARTLYLFLFITGAVSALAFAPLDLWPLAFACIALLVHSVAGARNTLDAFTRGYVFCAGQFVVGLNWIATAFTYQVNMPVWLGWVAVVLLA